MIESIQKIRQALNCASADLTGCIDFATTVSDQPVAASTMQATLDDISGALTALAQLEAQMKFAPELCRETERLHCSQMGGIVRTDDPLSYCPSRWNIITVVEIHSIPAGTGLNDLAKLIVKRGFDFFATKQRQAFSEL